MRQCLHQLKGIGILKRIRISACQMHRSLHEFLDDEKTNSNNETQNLPESIINDFTNLKNSVCNTCQALTTLFSAKVILMAVGIGIDNIIKNLSVSKIESVFVMFVLFNTT